jgi:hypothetical protein
LPLSDRLTVAGLGWPDSSSSRMGTVKELLVWPGMKVTVPLVGVYSRLGWAVPGLSEYWTVTVSLEAALRVTMMMLSPWPSKALQLAWLNCTVREDGGSCTSAASIGLLPVEPLPLPAAVVGEPVAGVEPVADVELLPPVAEPGSDLAAAWPAPQEAAGGVTQPPRHRLGEAIQPIMKISRIGSRPVPDPNVAVMRNRPSGSHLRLNNNLAVRILYIF